LSSTNLTVADFYRNHYYLSSPADNVILDYDLGLKSWWKHTLASGAVYDFTSRFNNSTEEFLCVSGGKVGQLFVPGVYQDFGSSFTWKWSGPWLAPGQAREVYPAVRKRLRALRVDGNGTATLTLSTDFNTAERAATPQGADGAPRASLFGTTSGTTFGPVANDGTYFGDYCNGSAPVTVISPTVFGDVQGPQQARVWGQGVARSWSVTFKDSVGSGAAATIQNYTIFTQERNQ
jgi:hypothetical protein